MICRNVFHDHHSVSILDILLQLVERPALCHDFRVLEELAEPELLGFPIDHRQFRVHNSIGYLSTVISNLPHLSFIQGDKWIDLGAEAAVFLLRRFKDELTHAAQVTGLD